MFSGNKHPYWFCETGDIDMGLQIEQLKNRAKEYAKAYHEKEVKRGVHKGEMEKSCVRQTG